jgi:hypothetical protein
VGKAQRKATAAHRIRSIRKGLIRVEVQAPKADQGLIRALAQELRGDAAKAAAVRRAVTAVLAKSPAMSALDVFGSELPDDAFEGVFSAKRGKTWRETGL